MGNQLDQSFTPVIHCHSPSMHSMGVSHSKLGGARYGCPAILLYHYQSAPLESQSSSKPFRMFGRKSVEKLVIPQIVAKASHHNNNQCACIYIYISSYIVSIGLLAFSTNHPRHSRGLSRQENQSSPNPALITGSRPAPSMMNRRGLLVSTLAIHVPTMRQHAVAPILSETGKPI